MKSLYLRVWLTLVALLALFALASGLLFKRQVDHQVNREVGRVNSVAAERMVAWGELLQNSLPVATADAADQAAALRDWSQRLRMPLALDDAKGQRIGASDAFVRRAAEGDGPSRAAPLNAVPIMLDDGRTLWVMRPRVAMGPGARGMDDHPPKAARWGLMAWPQGAHWAALLALLFVGVAVGAYPVIRRLTRRLEALKMGVEQFGAGQLNRRVDDRGGDEVAAVARSFNQAAARIESLLSANQSLLANASHELRSPLARLKMAVSLLTDSATPDAQRLALTQEIHTNITELDSLVEEVLLASRLDAAAAMEPPTRVNLRDVLIAEAARVQLTVATGAVTPEAHPWAGAVEVMGDERLLRRAVRNLLENALRYGGGSVQVALETSGDATGHGASASARAVLSVVSVVVADRGPGIPNDMRERIFEPFFRLPGHAERHGGVGLGLSLVRQIAQRHQGSVSCEPREGGGTCFVLRLPVVA
jgi:signal transduction histidine kinase